MKKDYLKPAIQVVHINTSYQLLAGSPVNSTQGNVFNQNSISGNNGDARSRGFDDFGE